MPILTSGQERKSGRRWAWVAAFGLLLFAPASALLYSTWQPVDITVGGWRAAIYHLHNSANHAEFVPGFLPWGIYGELRASVFYMSATICPATICGIFSTSDYQQGNLLRGVVRDE